MKAVVSPRYGTPDDMRPAEVPTPEVRPDEARVQVEASTVNPYDWHFLTGKPYVMRLFVGLARPKQPILGADVAGRVLEVGAEVTRFHPGDEVFGRAKGAYADQVAVAEHMLVHKPANLSFAQAAAVPISGLTALRAVRDDVQVQAGQRVLVIGAAGRVGTFAVQVAKAMGAEVTAVGSTSSLDLLRRIGADRVVDYTREDFADPPATYDALLDMVGTYPLPRLLRALKPTGRCVLVTGPKSNPFLGPFPHYLKAALRARMAPQTIAVANGSTTLADLEAMRDLLAAGKVVPVIERTYRFPDVAGAMRRFEAGHARGHVVITAA